MLNTNMSPDEIRLVTVAIQIPESRLIDLFSDAMSGPAIRYWCRGACGGEQALVDGTGVEFKTRDGYEPKYHLTIARMIVALEKLAAPGSRYARHAANFIADRGDAETTDVIIQQAIFGEVVYG